MGKDPTVAVVKFNAAFKTMEFNMVGKAAIRAFLILALIVTAHIIKPFSVKSVTQHLLYSTRSFKFVLPGQLRDKFDYANYLAINLSNSLFEGGKGIQNFAKDTAANFSLVAMAIKVQPLDEVNKLATKQRSGAKKSAPAKRVIRTEKNETADLSSLSGLVASVNSDEIAPVELPPAPVIETTRIIAPMVQPCVTKFFPSRVVAAAPPRPVELLVALRKNDCEKREAAKSSWIIWIEGATGLKATIRGAEKRRGEKTGLLTSECEDWKTEVVTEEPEIEIAEPEEEPIPPQMKVSQFSELFEKCSKEP